MDYIFLQRSNNVPRTGHDPGEHMEFFRKLELRFGKYAVPGLMRFFTALYAAGFVIAVWNPYAYYTYLALDPALILKGQVWRLFTFLIYPPSTSILWGVLLLWVYFSIGMTLECVWGTFKFNVFMFAGVFFHILAAFILYFATGSVWPLTPSNLNLSIFLAFALTFPEMQFYLYFVIPIKAKYLAAFYFVLEAYAFITGSMVEKVTIVLSLMNLFLFLKVSGIFGRFSPKEMKRRADFRKAAGGAPERKIVNMDRAGAANAGASSGKTARHRCAVCGRTELDAPELEFRYCSKCAGDYEYCMEHLYTHTHVQ